MRAEKFTRYRSGCRNMRLKKPGYCNPEPADTRRSCLLLLEPELQRQRLIPLLRFRQFFAEQEGRQVKTLTVGLKLGLQGLGETGFVGAP